MDKYGLSKVMSEHNDRQEELAKSIGISRSRFCEKVNGKAFFTIPEVMKIKARYSLSPEQVDKIFFSDGKVKALEKPKSDSKEKTARILILTEDERKRIIELSNALNEAVKVLECKSNVSEGTLQYQQQGHRHCSKTPLD